MEIVGERYLGRRWLTLDYNIRVENANFEFWSLL